MSSGAHPTPPRPRPFDRWPGWGTGAALSAGAGLFAFGVLWFALLRQLSVEWTLNAQSRWQAVLERRRNLGQRSLEVVIGGVPDLAAARTTLHAGWGRLLTVP